MKPYLSLPLAGSVIALCLAFSAPSQAAVSGAHLTAPPGAHASTVTKAHWWRHHHHRHYRHYRHCRWHNHHRVCR